MLVPGELDVQHGKHIDISTVNLSDYELVMFLNPIKYRLTTYVTHEASSLQWYVTNSLAKQL